MTGLLWTATEKTPIADVDAMQQLKAHVERAEHWNRRLWETLAIAAGRVAELGIEVVAIKGVMAEARWYRRVGERPCRDIDLLLAPKDLGRADEVIRVLQPDHPLTSIAPTWVNAGALQAATLAIEDVTVDVHFDPLKLGIPCRQAELVWSRTQREDLPGGGTVRLLDPETALILFLLHLNKDRYRYLLGFVDVQRVLAQEAIDWDFVAGFLAAEGLSTPVALSLEVVRDTLGLAVPALPHGRGVRARVWAVTWRPSIQLRGEEGRRRFRKRQELIPLLATGRVREGLVNARRVLFPPRDLYEIANPGEQGGYLRRLMITRPARYLRRLRR
jgi:hypothetical protein